MKEGIRKMIENFLYDNKIEINFFFYKGIIGRLPTEIILIIGSKNILECHKKNKKTSNEISIADQEFLFKLWLETNEIDDISEEKNNELKKIIEFIEKRKYLFQKKKEFEKLSEKSENKDNKLNKKIEEIFRKFHLNKNLKELDLLKKKLKEYHEKSSDWYIKNYSEIDDWWKNEIKEIIEIPWEQKISKKEWEFFFNKYEQN